jgi:proline iminopeptidase
MVEDLACVHRSDQRGGGRSIAKGMPDVDGLIADLETLRTHRGHQQWIVGGHSWGANLALLYALAHPDRVTGVIYM